MKHTVVGLDLSLKSTGVCVLTGQDTVPIRITRLIEGPKTSGVLQSIARLDMISGEIIALISSYDAKVVIIEAAALNQKWQAAAIGELHGVVKNKIFNQLHIVPMVEQATKMRKVVVGKIGSKREKYIDTDGEEKTRTSYGRIPSKIGKKTKKATVKDIIEGRLREQGILFDNQDEMDAYVTAKYGWDVVNAGQ